MKCTSLLVLFLCSGTLFSQLQPEIAGIQYNYFGSSSYNNDIYSASTQHYRAFINYGHDLGKKNSLFYHISFQRFDLDTKTNIDLLPLDDSFLYPEIPDHSLTTGAIGMKNELKNNWALTHIFTLTFAHENNQMETSNYFRTFNYATKKKSEKISYGLGVYTDNIPDKIRILPVINFQYTNSKRGMKIFFPREVKVWHHLSKKSFLELHSAFDANRLDYKNANDLTVEVYTINTGLTYNYIHKNKWRFNLGVGLPHRRYEYTADNTDFETTQTGGLAFTLGTRFIVN